MIELVYNSIKQMKQDAFIRKANEDATYWLIPDNRIVTGIRINIRKEVKIMKKNFKKIVAVALSCVLTLGMTVNALAADPDPSKPDQFDSRDGITTTDTNYYKFDTNKTSTRDVKVKIVDPEKIYRIDVTWESMEFTYEFNTWDPDSHTFKDSTNTTSTEAGAFYVDVNGTKTKRSYAKVNVMNHSNADVSVAFAYAGGTTTLSGVSADIYADNEGKTAVSPSTIGTATNHIEKFSEAENKSAYVVVSGTPNVYTTNSEFVTIGQVTVTISK